MHHKDNDFAEQCQALVTARRDEQTDVRDVVHKLVEVETIAHVSARLIVNRVSLKTKPHAVQAVLRAIRDHITSVEKKRVAS